MPSVSCVSVGGPFVCVCVFEIDAYFVAHSDTQCPLTLLSTVVARLQVCTRRGTGAARLLLNIHNMKGFFSISPRF